MVKVTDANVSDNQIAIELLGSVDISTEPDKSGDKTTKLRNPK